MAFNHGVKPVNQNKYRNTTKPIKAKPTKKSYTTEILEKQNARHLGTTGNTAWHTICQDKSGDNYGKWHIDHIKPISSFNINGINSDDFKKCWSLNNLQPLWAKDNLQKGNK